ncbi:GntR family transcriptional regulator [Streptomyces mirabilis]|uniref:GntR family transcriptional regulator n=1 Tax=Streptomyces mirabilis TaxID=68239 RepID=UPI00331FC64C
MAARLPLEGERRSLREIAYASIRRAIIELRLPPGEFITEESLSAELGVSRPVVSRLRRCRTFTPCGRPWNNCRSSRPWGG